MRNVVFLLGLVACGSPASQSVPDLAVVSVLDAGPDASLIASCGTCDRCCMPDGRCPSGDKTLATQCGDPGTICEDCATKGNGYYCQYGAVLGQRCTIPQGNGSPCVDSGDCGSQYCDEHGVCATLCTTVGAACITGNAVCCDAPRASCAKVGNDPNIQCCFGFGAVVDLAGCANCCDRFQPGFKCAKDTMNNYHCGS